MNFNNFVSCYRAFSENAYAPFTGRQRIGVILCNVIFSVYISAVIILHVFADVVPNFRTAILCSIVLVLFIYQLFKLFVIKFGNLHISRNIEREKFSWKVFIITSAAVFIIFIPNLFAHYPGGVSNDNVSQWIQIQSGQFENWHPAIHTMIIWLITRIVLSYSFVIFVQILAFSLLSGYMAATLKAWGIKYGWLIAFVIVLISPRSNYELLIHAWKDTALSILLLCLSVYTINIVLSDGKWLMRWQNVAAISIIGTLATLVRHNGFLFTLPLGILIIFLYRKTTRNAIYAAAAAILVILGITQGLYRIVDVNTQSSQTYTESVSLPLTILIGVHVNSPDKLDSDAVELLNSIAGYDDIADAHHPGNINRVKSRYTAQMTESLEKTPPAELLLMTVRTIRNAPKESLLEVIALTRMVWNPHDSFIVGISSRGLDIVYTQDDVESMMAISDISREINTYIRSAIMLLTPSRALTAIGLHLLFLILAGVYSVNRNLGAKALVLFLPGVFYAFGTMMLLSGDDYRLFHFCAVTSFPLIIALLSRYETTGGVDNVDVTV